MSFMSFMSFMIAGAVVVGGLSMVQQRNVTVTFDDGTSHVYNHVPNNITPDQIIQRASIDYKTKTITKIDGGRHGSLGTRLGKGVVKFFSNEGHTSDTERLSIKPVTPSDVIVGGAETAANVATGTVGTVLGMVAGNLARANNVLTDWAGGNAPKLDPMATKESVVQGLTYQPRTETGKGMSETVSSAFSNTIGIAQRFAGDVAGGLGADKLLQSDIHDAVGLVLPVKIGKAVKAVKARSVKIAERALATPGSKTFVGPLESGGAATGSSGITGWQAIKQAANPREIMNDVLSSIRIYKEGL